VDSEKATTFIADRCIVWMYIYLGRGSSPLRFQAGVDSFPEVETIDTISIPSFLLQLPNFIPFTVFFLIILVAFLPVGEPLK